MELRIHPREAQGDFILQIWDKRAHRWKKAAGPYKDAGNAKVGQKHYEKYRGEDFNTRVGRQLMALKDWGKVKL